jgi:hypothetical protein
VTTPPMPIDRATLRWRHEELKKRSGRAARAFLANWSEFPHGKDSGRSFSASPLSQSEHLARPGRQSTIYNATEAKADNSQSPALVTATKRTAKRTYPFSKKAHAAALADNNNPARTAGVI